MFAHYLVISICVTANTFWSILYVTLSTGMGLFTAQKIAEIRKLSLDEVLTQVRENVRGMYGI